MDSRLIFINRRKGSDRRVEADPCRDMPIDLYGPKRRKSEERRAERRSLADDYYSFVESAIKRNAEKSSDGSRPDYN